MNRRYGRKRAAVSRWKYGRRAGARRINWKGAARLAHKVTFVKKKIMADAGGAAYFQSQPTSLATAFSLNQLPEAAAYQQLYDQFKITGIKATFVPQVNVNESATGSGATDRMVVPTITMYVDENDATNGEVEADMIVRGNAKTRMFNKPVSIFFKPKVLKGVGGLSGAQAIATDPYRKGTWLNTTKGQGDECPHYGLKWCVTNAGATSQETTYRLFFTYYLAFKQSK